MIEFTCSCGHEIRVPENLTNLEGRCPECDKYLRVPVPPHARKFVRREQVVNMGKSPIAFVFGAGDVAGIEVQASTYISGYVYMTLWYAFLGGAGYLARTVIKEGRESTMGLFKLFGWEEDWSTPTVLIWVVVNILAIRISWAVVKAMYFKTAGKTFGASNRRDFAVAGGFDVARYAPVVCFAALTALYLLTYKTNSRDAISAIRNPWVFSLIGTAMTAGLAWIASRILFRVKYGQTGTMDGLGNLMTEAMKQEDENIRVFAVANVGKQRDPRGINLLIEGLKDPSTAIRWKAADELGKLGDVRARDALVEATNDQQEFVRLAARKALRKLDKAQIKSRKHRHFSSKPTTTHWKKVYIFISSTFNDMHAERDYLVKQVFPQLREWCERRKLRLVDIDLRWGVTEQDTRNRSVVEVCLNRIDQCRPFFLCFMGQRRGWVPREEDVSSQAFRAFPELQGYIGNTSITELETVHALLNPLHPQQPDSEETSEYYQPAKHAFFYLRDPSWLRDLPTDVPLLRQVYTNEWLEDSMERQHQDQILNEWREETIPQSGRPVHVYRVRWDSNAATPELMLPLRCPSLNPAVSENWRKAWAAAGVTVTGLNIEDDSLEATRARAFNQRLSSGRLTGFESEGMPLSQVILGDLQRAIAARYPEHNESIVDDELQKEIDQQEYFLFINSEGFIERLSDFVELDEYVESDSNKCFVLAGAGGGGKSMLLANWVDRERTRLNQEGEEAIHFRFVGASDQSTNINSMLRLLLLEMRAGKRFDADIPADPVKLRSVLPELLETVGRRGKTIIVIDGLNKLETGLSDLSWLPAPLPHGIKLIVSFRSDDSQVQADEFYRRCYEDENITLSRVRPFVDSEDRRRLVKAYLSQYLKELDDTYLEALIETEGAENPLYLKVALSELRVFGAFANLSERIRNAFGHTPVSAFEGVLRRLETDPTYTELDAHQVVPLIFGFLAHSRRGLSEDELTSLLVENYPWAANSLNGSQAVSRRGRAQDTVNLYLRQVRPFLARSDGRYGFFYESFEIAVKSRYVRGSSASTVMNRSTEDWHGLLAEFFQDQPLYISGSTKTNTHKLDELPWQQTHAGLWRELKETLCNLEFIEAKCLAGMTYDLVQDYTLAQRAWPDEYGQATSAGPGGILPVTSPEPVRLFAHFVSLHAHIFARDGTQVIAFAYNYAATGPVVEDAVRCLRVWGWDDNPWIQLIDRPSLIRRPALLRILEGHRGEVTSLAVSADAKLLVSGSMDGTLRFWDVQTGISLRTVEAHAGGVKDLAITPDCKTVASAGVDENVRIWDADSGVCLKNLWRYKQPGSVNAVRIAADGRSAVSGGEDGKVKVWDLETDELVSTLRGHFGPVNCLDVSSDGSVAVSGGWDCSIRMWDIPRGRLIDCIEGHTVSVQGIATGKDAAVIASSGGIPAGPTGTAPRGLHESDVRFWTREGYCFFVGTEHQVSDRGGSITGVLGSTIYDIAMTPDARLAISGGYDRAVWLWDVRQRLAIREFTGHTDSVLSVAIDPSGVLGITGGIDRTIRVWQLDGETTPVASINRRIGKLGKGMHIPLEEKAALMFRNRRIQTLAIIPLLAVVLAYLVYVVITRLFDSLAALGISNALIESVFKKPGVSWIALGLTALYLAGMIYHTRWRWSLAAESAVWKPDVLPKSLRFILRAPLMMLSPFFAVFKCPSCGHTVCGRRRLFHCASCGWRDVAALNQDRFMEVMARLAARFVRKG